MSKANVYLLVVLAFCFFVTTRSKEFNYHLDVCQTKVNDSSEYCTCMPFHKFKKMCCSTYKRVNFQEPLQKEMQDTNQTMRELREQIVEISEEGEAVGNTADYFRLTQWTGSHHYYQGLSYKKIHKSQTLNRPAQKWDRGQYLQTRRIWGSCRIEANRSRDSKL